MRSFPIDIRRKRGYIRFFCLAAFPSFFDWSLKEVMDRVAKYPKKEAV